MINLIKNKITSNQTKKINFINSFFSDKNHEWIFKNNHIKKAFQIMFNDLKDHHVDFLIKHKIYFIPCQAKLSCAIGKTKNHHLILIFPELITILQSASFHHGIAILMHELGHIYYQHTENKVDTLLAQIEADHFAFENGYGEELQEVLLDHIDSVDCRVRISKLTTKLIENKFNQ